MSVLWRRMLLHGAGAALLAPAVCAGDAFVVVLASSGAPAYREAVAGFRATAGAGVVRAVFEMGEGDGAVMDRVQAFRPRLIVAMGSLATAAVTGLDVPVLSAMVMESDAVEASGPGQPKRIVLRIPLDVPPRLALTRLKGLFPDRRRIAVIWGPAGNRRPRSEIAAEAAQLGLALKFVECRHPREMLEAIPALAGAADLVWCLPDRVLYQPAPVQALILSSIRARLPLVGFSASFVKAGALAGFQADYWQIGAQTAESALRLLEGTPLKAREDPRTVRTYINERAVRIFGAAWRQPPGEETVLVR